MNNNDKRGLGKGNLFFVQKLKNLIKTTKDTEIFWLGDDKKNKWINRFNRIKYYHYKYFIFRLSQIRPFIFSIKTFFGLRMYFRVPEHYYFLLWGFFPETEQTNEANLTAFLIKNIKKDDIFFDIGANCGFYSILAKKFIGENGQIHAFEPTPSIFKLLKRTMAKFKNSHLNEQAVFSKKGYIDFFLNEFSVGNTIKVSSNYEAKEYKKITVEAITLDDYCNDLSIVPTIIKIDVEGGEENVIIGAQKILAKGSPLIAMEVWRNDNQSHRNAFSMLINLGYEPYWINKEGNLLKIFSSSLKINFDDCLKNGGLQMYDNILFKK